MMRRSWTTIACGLSAAILIGPPIARSSSQPFDISISTARDTFKSGEEIRLQIAITNTSDHDMTISRAIDDTSAEIAGFSVEVEDQKGNPAPDTRYRRVLRDEDSHPPVFTVSSILLPLASGQTYRDALIVNKFYDLRKGGTFKIQVERIDGPTKAVIKSNVITVTVSAQPSDHPCRVVGGAICEEIYK